MPSANAKSFVIAIDGPAASGKGTLAKGIAEHYQYAYLDTGLLYRHLAAQLLRHSAPPYDEKKIFHGVGLMHSYPLPEEDLRSLRVASTASNIAALPAVRDILRHQQQDFAARPPHGAAGAVLDGRDIGTVICPQADVKIYVTASVSIRAHRRWLEQKEIGTYLTDILTALKKRDAQDAQRHHGPLKRAANAHLLDTTNYDRQTALAKAIVIIDEVLHNGKKCHGKACP